MECVLVLYPGEVVFGAEECLLSVPLVEGGTLQRVGGKEDLVVFGGVSKAKRVLHVQDPVVSCDRVS